MATVELGPTIQQARGSVGGVVFSNDRSGPVLRRRSVPIDPAHPLQRTFRANHGIIAARWRDTVTPAQRAAWDLLGVNSVLRNRLGTQYQPTGFSLYMRANNVGPDLALPVFDAAPPTALFQMPRSVWAQAPAGAIGYSVLASSNPFPAATVVAGRSDPMPLSHNKHSGPWLDRRSAVAPAPGGGPVKVFPDGTTVLGFAYFIRWRLQGANGELTAAMIYRFET